MPVTLCVFNPEHDLCLANGDPNYVPPASALDFARHSAGVMRIIYGDEVVAIAADGYVDWRHNNPDADVEKVIAWGWDSRLCRQLYKQGMEKELMPSDDKIELLRRMQHRSTILPLQPDCRAVTTVDEMQALLGVSDDWVMKAPWSGAGRGLRWVHGELSLLDCDWLRKTVAAQHCVIAEPRRDVVADIAFEYIDSRFVGYSFFRTGGGVYRENILLSDDEFAVRFSYTDLQKKKIDIECWLDENIWPNYDGPLGVDLMVCVDGKVYVSEVTLRHTMGLVAHSFLQQHPEMEGCVWTPELVSR